MLIIALSAWAIIAPEQADTVIGGVVAWVASHLAGSTSSPPRWSSCSW
ncbi:hypothetical protein [Kocuria atrinae]